MSAPLGDDPAPAVLPRWLLYTCCLLLVACTIPWRRGTYFSGGLDPVVAVKGVIGSLGLALSGYCARRGTARVHPGPATMALAAAYLAVSFLGGWGAGEALPSAVVAVRVIMLLVSLAFLLGAFGVSDLVHAMVYSMGAVGLLAALTGVGTLGSGRLSGGVPPVAPNEIAFLTGVVLLLTVHRLMEGTARRWEPWLAAGLAAIVWLTGSRTTLATLVLAVFLMLVQARRFTVPAFVALVAAIPAAAFAILATSAVSNLVLRGGDQNVTTLASRTIAWQAALSLDTGAWQHLFGGGLTLKHIPVSGQYWETQLLDSSWVSALVQTGLVGLGIALVWVLAVLVGAVRSHRPWRPLWLGLFLFVVVRSLLESGMFDASTSFMVFALVSLTTEKAVRMAEPEGSVATGVLPTRPDTEAVVVGHPTGTWPPPAGYRTRATASNSLHMDAW